MDPALLIKVAGPVAAILKESFAEKERAWIDKTLVEATQVGTCVAVALLSLSLNRQPFDHEVQEFLGKLVGDPSGPARVRRLLGEMLKSPSRERRVRLAAVFFAGPKICSTPPECDRLDLLAERMLDDDAFALRQLVDCDSPDGFLIEGPHGQAA